jgi:hypothetical protein
MSPSQPGAIKLARRYGDALVCVRYRGDPRRLYRYTTIELVVDKVLIRSRSVVADEIVSIKLDYNEKPLHSIVRASGGRWDAKTRLWRLPHKIAKQLGLLARVTKK